MKYHDVVITNKQIFKDGDWTETKLYRISGESDSIGDIVDFLEDAGITVSVFRESGCQVSPYYSWILMEEQFYALVCLGMDLDLTFA